MTDGFSDTSVTSVATHLIRVGTTAVVVVVCYRITRHQVPDDAFIFARYARNIADGHGWVFNPGADEANGATSPLWTSLLAVAGLVGLPIVGTAIVLYGAGTVAATVVIASDLDGYRQRTAAWLVGPFVALNPLLNRMKGMESGLALALIALTLHWGVARRRPAAAGVAAALLTLTRPEGVVLASVVGAVAWRSDGRPPWRMAGWFVAALAPWVAAGTALFGSPVAGTLAAKMAQERSGYFGPPFSYLRHVNQMLTQSWSVALLGAAILGVAVVWRRPMVRPYLGVLAVAVSVQVVVYGVVLRPPAYPWYYAAPYLLAAVLAAVGVGGAIEVAVARVAAWRPAWAAPSRSGLVAAGAVVAVLAYSAVVSRWLYRNDPYSGYHETGRWLAASTPADASVSATEIGVLGWESDRRIVEHLGLLDERTVDEFARRDVTSWFLREQPDYVVVHAPVWPFEVPTVRTDEFRSSYRPVFESGYGDGPADHHWSHVRVYERVVPSNASPGGLLADRFVDAIEGAGVELSPRERRAVTEVVVDLVGSRARQQELDRRRGVDVVELLEHYRDDPLRSGASREPLRSVADRLTLGLDGARLLVTVAPRAEDLAR